MTEELTDDDRREIIRLFGDYSDLALSGDCGGTLGIADAASMDRLVAKLRPAPPAPAPDEGWEAGDWVAHLDLSNGGDPAEIVKLRGFDPDHGWLDTHGNRITDATFWRKVTPDNAVRALFGTGTGLAVVNVADLRDALTGSTDANKHMLALERLAAVIAEAHE